MRFTDRVGRCLRTQCLGLLAAAVGMAIGASAQAQCQTYTIATGSATFIGGATTDIGNHCDDCSTLVALPFPVTFYGGVYNACNVSSNGWLDFTASHTGSYANACLPATTTQFTGAPGPLILPFWDDGYTTDTAGGQGIFTQTVGAAPNRQFVIEWRTAFCCATGAPVNNYEVIFTEGSTSFDIVYGTTMADRGSATVGVQESTTSTFNVQYSCNTAGQITPGLSLHVTCVPPPPTSGACCTAAGVCNIANSSADCTGAGNFFFGVGTACTATTCPIGACCNGANCSTIIQTACTAGAGTFFAAGSCSGAFPAPTQGVRAVEDISIGGPNPGTAWVMGGNGGTASLDDGTNLGIPLGFTFNFFGNAFTDISVCTNGFAYFGTGNYTTYAPPAIPNIATPNNVIAPMWVDMLLASADQITYATKGVAPFQRFIVQWTNAPRYNGGAQTGANTFQIIIYESADAIEFRYGNLDPGVATAVPQVGVESADGLLGTSVPAANLGSGNLSLFWTAAANPCTPAAPTGSCCLNGCQVITYANCLAGGGAYNGNGTTCVSAPCNSGACCALAGGCSIQVGPVCTADNGSYLGNGTTCGAPPCPPAGRCCSGTSCNVGFQANCTGVFTANQTCTPNNCAGSCCDSGGLCTLATSAGTCSGTFGGLGTTCQPSPCPGQSCASPIPLTLGVSVPGDLAASVTTSTITCSSGTHGLWYSFTAASDATYAFNSTLTSGAGNPSIGIFGPCGTQLACVNPCTGTNTTATLAMTSGQQVVFRAGGCGDVQLTYNVTVSIAVVGACCNDTSGACTVTNSGAAGCAAGTTYMGENSVCSAALCGQGACCNDSTAACTLTTATGCTVGTFQGAGSACVTGACPTQACCDAATGTCTVVGPAGPCPGSSTGQGAGTSCTPNPCPQPPTGACCNNTTGACTQVFAANCSATTSTYSGDNTVCNGAGICPGIGTCCSSLGNCVVIYAGSCPAGLTSNASTTCTTNLCPAVGPHICQNFDSDAVGALPANWTSTTTGAGAAWVIDAAQSNSAPNAVFTNDVASVSSQFLVMPDVVSGASGLTLDFTSYYQTENTFDGFVVEFSTDAGATWTDIAVGGAWVLNGYNLAAISNNFNSPIAGRPAFSGAGTVWTDHIATIPSTAGQTVSIRFQMASDSSVTSTGVWLDNICVGGIQGAAANGVCCRGMTCSAAFADAAACAAATPAHAGSPDPFYRYFPAVTVCNTAPVPPNSMGNATTPCCFGNYNHNATLEVQDIFDFLNDWFAGRPIAIPSGDGTSTAGLAVQNIFDFLNAWFAGGCN